MIVFQSADPDFFVAHGDMGFVDDPAAFGSLAVARSEDLRLNPMMRLHERIRRLPQVTIGKLAGLARGGGAELLMALDMRFAAVGRAGLGQPEVLTGIIPGAGAPRCGPAPRRATSSCVSRACSGSSRLRAPEHVDGTPEPPGRTLVGVPTSPPDKTCAACGRRIVWRKKWERDWEQVRFCSAGCRRHGVDETDRRLEQAVLDLLAARARGATICPSEAARAVGGDGWRELMEPARRAARRLVDAEAAEITQGGRVVDPSTARGPIRIRRAR